MLVNKLCVDVLLLKSCRLHSHKSFQSNYYVYYDLNNSALDFFIQFYRNCFLNSKLVLVVKVQTFYVNTSCSILNWTKSQIEANSDCPEHNGRDINHLKSRHFNCLPKVAKFVCRGSKHDSVFLLSVYTRLT